MPTCIWPIYTKNKKDYDKLKACYHKIAEMGYMHAYCNLASLVEPEEAEKILEKYNKLYKQPFIANLFNYFCKIKNIVER